MPDENGMETSSSDVPGDEEILFGDAEDAEAEAVVEEEDSSRDTGQEPRGSGDAGDQTGQPDELKVVVSVRGDRATIGVQQPSSDPHIESFDELDLSGLAGEVPAVIERARAKWEDEPRHPAHERPAPPARRRTRREQAPAQVPAAEGEEDQQQPETLRLF